MSQRRLFAPTTIPPQDARTPTPEPITKVNLLLKGVVRRVSILSSLGVHLPEVALNWLLEFLSHFLDILTRLVVARQDFIRLFLWGVIR